MNQADQYREYKELGTIQLDNKIIVSDPCYDLYDRGPKTIDILPGTYTASVCYADCNHWGKRVAYLSITHNEYQKLEQTNQLKYKELTGTGVDSGQMGIFDYNAFVDASEEEKIFGDPENFYGKCCEITLKKSQAGIVYDKNTTIGVVSSSGWGDGYYPIYIAKENNQVIAVCIVFIDSEEILESHEQD